MFKCCNLDRAVVLFSPMPFNSLIYYLWQMIVSVGLEREAAHYESLD